MLVFFAAVATTAAIVVPSGPALDQAIAAADSELFELMFDRCDPSALRAMVTDDLEFYHDKDGLVVGGQKFVDDAASSCAGWAKPDAWRSRRALSPGTVRVDPVPGFGAIETGEHLFYERKGSGPESLVGRARFAIVWSLGSDGRWRMKRALSYAHSAEGD